MWNIRGGRGTFNVVHKRLTKYQTFVSYPFFYRALQVLFDLQGRHVQEYVLRVYNRLICKIKRFIGLCSAAYALGASLYMTLGRDKEFHNFGIGQNPPFSGGQARQAHPADPGTVQGFDEIAPGGKHPADLVITPFL